MPATPIPYAPDIEAAEPNERETARALNEALLSISKTTAKDYGRAVRSVHAKGHAFLEGTLTVHDNLPAELAQGLFQQPNQYPAIARISTIPGDIIDDRISVPRGFALKVMNVKGERLEGSESASTQDFLMVDGPAFGAPTAKAFLGNLQLLAKTTGKAEWAKLGLSFVLRGVEKGLEAIGQPSGLVKTLGGHSMTNPAGSTYYSQTPFRFGAYVAKFSLKPASANLVALVRATVKTKGRDHLREALEGVFTSDGATWELQVQLRTHAGKMPVEDASAVWPEDLSPYRTVADFTVQAQSAWNSKNADLADDQLSFNPWHGLAAHRPLGSVNRVRKLAYKASSDFRSTVNKCPVQEPGEGYRLPR